MKPPPPPLRFLLLIVGGWACLRGAYVATLDGELPEAGRSGPFFADAAPELLKSPLVPTAPPAEKDSAAVPIARISPPEPYHWAAPRPATILASRPPPVTFQIAALAPDAPTVPAVQLRVLPPSPTLQPPLLRSPIPSRWSASGWVHLRQSDAGGLAPGGTLGGSQAGARLTYRIGGTLSVSARLYSPLGRPHGAEAALGIDWQPSPRLPLHLLAERRQRIGREGRSDFALTAFGGVSERRLPGGLRLEAYGQAGVVGLRARDPFVDAAAHVSARVGPVDLGGGVWGAAQPGVSRLDVGPQASVRLPLGNSSIRVSADWRFRVAGEAAPASGPSLTIGTDF